jgi:hypothetical protein
MSSANRGHPQTSSASAQYPFASFSDLIPQLANLNQNKLLTSSSRAAIGGSILAVTIIIGSFVGIFVVRLLMVYVIVRLERSLGVGCSGRSFRCVWIRWTSISVKLRRKSFGGEQSK